MPKRYIVLDTEDDGEFGTYISEISENFGDIKIDGWLKVLGQGDTLPELVTNMLERKL